MDIQSLENLKKNGIIFELYSQVIVNNYSYGVYSFTCEDKHNMRIDKICLDIYNNKDNIDIISALNGIYNVLTVQSGMTIYFVEDKDINNIRSNQDVLDALVNSVASANAGKEMKRDVNRANEIANQTQTEKNKKFFVPPNIVQSSTGNIDFTEGAIILKPNF